MSDYPVLGMDSLADRCLQGSSMLKVLAGFEAKVQVPSFEQVMLLSQSGLPLSLIILAVRFEV